MRWGPTGFSLPAFELFPDSAAREDGELSLGGVRASRLAEEFGTPLVVYCEQTLLAHAEAYRSSAPDALLLYSVKAFPSVAILELVAGAGYGADVSTAGADPTCVTSHPAASPPSGEPPRNATM